MKKALSIVAILAFILALGSPVQANNTTISQAIEIADEDPKKAKKSDKKSAECTTKKTETSSSCKKTCDDDKKKK